MEKKCPKKVEHAEKIDAERKEMLEMIAIEIEIEEQAGPELCKAQAQLKLAVS